MKRFDGFGEHRLARRHGGVGGLDGEEQAELRIDIERLDRVRGERSSGCNLQVALRPHRLSPGDQRKRASDHGSGGEHADEEPQPKTRPPFQGCLPPPALILRDRPFGALPKAGSEECTLNVGESEPGGLVPGLEPAEPLASHQVAGISPCTLPLPRRGAQHLLVCQIGAAEIDPFTQARPLFEERLMSDLHSGVAGDRIAVE